MKILGLTGSIGMGKSTTAGLFREAGVPVNDADEVVHDLYRGEAVAPVAEAFPGTIIDGIVDRQALSRRLAENPALFKKLEEIVHPLVKEKERRFIHEHKEKGSALVVLDIPLLFEVGGEGRVDHVAVVSCSPEEQRRRVLERPGMTPEKFELILSRQIPDAEKRARADFVIDTGHGIGHARIQVRAIIDQLTGERT